MTHISLLIIPTAPQRLQYPPLCTLSSLIWTRKTPRCQNPVHWFQLSIQYHHPSETNGETQHFLTKRPQSFRVGNNTSNSIMLSTWSSQGCVLCPLLFTLLTQDCASRHEGNLIIKFTDDTTGRPEGYCKENNLVLNADKTKEMIIDFRRSQPEHAFLSISGRTVERVENIKFLGCRSHRT